jgi:cell wall-associated NlpC family hydrolase
MKFSRLILCVFVFSGLYACIMVPDKKQNGDISSIDSSNAYSSPDTMALADSLPKDSVVGEFFKGKEINTKNIEPQQIVQFAKTLMGTPYRYASTDPKKGFDCSGFITYVFSHFNIIVPRSSIDFTNVGRKVSSDSARAGDLILFTGTDSTEKFVGHMGLVISNEMGEVNFIHSSSGKNYGVIITPLNAYYRSRYMKTIRIFP